MNSWYMGGGGSSSYSNGYNGYNGYQGDAPEEARKTMEALERVGEEIKKLRTPTGKKDAPGTTCRDIAIANPTYKNGLYWIDPNGGSTSDAIRVFCKMKAERTMTCLQSATHVYETKRWAFTKRDMGYWSFASSFEEKEEFDYDTLRSQIRLLQRHTENARQRLVVYCKDTVTIYDKANNSYDKAMVLTSFDEELLTARSKKSHRYSVLRDTCQEKNGRAGQTVIEVSGANLLKRLPILDVGFAEQTEGEFGLKIGRACFWGR